MEEMIFRLAYLALCSMGGVLIRVGWLKVHAYAGDPLSALIHVQFLGCFVMGVTVAATPYLAAWNTYIVLGLSTGLAGSITTFSGWMLDTFLTWHGLHANQTGDSRVSHWVLGGLTQLYVTLAMSIVGYLCGRQTILYFFPPVTVTEVEEEDTVESEHASFVEASVPARLQLVPTPVAPHLLDTAVLVLTVMLCLALVLLSILWEASRYYAWSCLFAVVGTLLRWGLSLWLNGRTFDSALLDYTMGTFTANMVGTVLLGVLYTLMHTINPSTTSCNLLFALADGLCGCLTTVSTFVVELLNTQRPIRPIRYALVSILLGQVSLFLLPGLYHYLHGISLGVGCTR